MTGTPPNTGRRPVRRARAAGLAAVAGIVLALATPAAASAHVGIDPGVASPGDSTVLTFSFSHGCQSSPTTGLRITMPEGLTQVAPDVDALWDVELTRGEDGLVDEVAFTAAEPIENGLRGTVSMSVRIAEDATGPLAFPVEQRCVDGTHAWTQIPQDGQDPHDVESPAPMLALGERGEHDGHAAAAAAPAASDPMPLVLGAGGVLLGAAALFVAIAALRSRS